MQTLPACNAMRSIAGRSLPLIGGDVTGQTSPPACHACAGIAGRSPSPAMRGKIEPPYPYSFSLKRRGEIGFILFLIYTFIPHHAINKIGIRRNNFFYAIFFAKRLRDCRAPARAMHPFWIIHQKANSDTLYRFFILLSEI